jgi:hypothetical protein
MDGSGVEEIVVSMAKSKAKVSRKWNSLIRMANGPSFGRAYRLSTVEEQNTKKQDYWNFSVAIAGFPPEELYPHGREDVRADREGQGCREPRIR